MNRIVRLLLVGCFLSCGTADDDGTSSSRSTDVPPPPGAAPPGAGSGEAAADRSDAVQLVFLGTSLTAGLGLLRDSERFTDRVAELADSAGIPVVVMNAGVSGDTSAGGLRRLAWVLQQPADVLVVELGANDGLRGQSVPAMKENLRSVIEGARELSPGVRVLLGGMEAPPNLGARYTVAFREAFRDLAREEGVALVPFLLEGVAGVAELNQADRIHPNAAGHRIIAATLWPHLEPLLREAAAARAGGGP